MNKKITFLKKSWLLAAAVVTLGLWGGEANAEVILEENFDAFTEGSIEKPAEEDIAYSYATGKLGATLSGWRGSKVYEAGGSLLIGEFGNISSTGAYLQPKLPFISSRNGNVKITMKVKSTQDFGNLYNLLGQTAVVNDDEWHELVFVVSYLSTTGSRISSTLGLPFFIDYLKIEQDKSFVLTPTAYRPGDFNGTTFTASWKTVSGADSYLLDVYSYKADGEKEYVLHDEEVAATSKEVTVADPAKKYYYTVRAKAGENISLYSEEQDVVLFVASLDAPEATDATGISAKGFTANWKAVENADNYIVSLSKTVTLTEATEISVISEDFSGVKDGTFASPEYGSLREYLNSYTKVPGWYAELKALASGYMGLSPYGGDGILSTPMLDLSKAGGKFSLIVNMAEMQYGSAYVKGGSVKVELLDAEGTVLETKDITLDAEEFKDYTVEFEKGAKDTYLKFTYTGSNKLWFDAITVNQEYAAGDVYTSVEKEVETSDLSYAFEMPLESGTTYGYSVVATVETVTSNGDDTTVYSPSSNVVTFTLPEGGVAEAVDRGVKVTVAGGRLVVTLDNAAAVNVYDAMGRLVDSRMGNAGANYFDADGFVIVNVGGKSYKAVVK